MPCPRNPTFPPSPFVLLRASSRAPRSRSTLDLSLPFLRPKAVVRSSAHATPATMSAPGTSRASRMSGDGSARAHPCYNRPVRCRSEDIVTPPAVQAAINAGQAAEVVILLTPLPEGMSKALMKKLVKQAEVNGKKLSQGKTVVAQAAQASSEPTAAAPTAAPSKPTVAVTAAPAAARPLAPAVAPAMSGVGDIDSDAIVADIVACIEGLGLPAEAIATLHGRQGVLSNTISPRLNAMRNRAYAQGFTARG